MTTNAFKKSFWTLINDSSIDKIIIPDIQRDYAEGRKDKKTETIRKSLIKYLCEGLKEKDVVCNLNFIYGTVKEININGITEKHFIPIDGQQRLTTLFLLHWYVFAKGKCDDNCFETLEKFSYATRITSEQFCKKLCGIHEFEGASIKVYLESLKPFTGNIKRDPSVQSMLVVLDEIENCFRSIGIENYSELAEKLMNNECNIEFLWLDIGNFNEEDLYIKMNSRGKNLNNFEIFKAKLQNSAALNSICENDNESKLNYIGRINNEYSDLFYSTFGKEKFDSGLMSFVVSVIKCDHFSYIAKRFSQKDYRDYLNIGDVNASAFYNAFVANPKSQWESANNVSEEELKDVVKKSLEKIDFILQLFLSKPDNFIPEGYKQKYYEFSMLLNDYESPSLIKYVKQYAVFEFLYTFMINGIPFGNIASAYWEWKRLCYNIIENTVEKFNSEDAGALLSFFALLVSHINTQKGDNPLTVQTVRKALYGYTDENIKIDLGVNVIPRSLYQLNEERMKCGLILGNNQWEGRIIEAESYFKDGQINFIFEHAKKNNENECTIQEFDNCYSTSKRLFNHYKSLLNEIPWHVFQRAVFCCPDNSPDKRAYLIPKTNWKMHQQDDSYKEMLKSLDMKPIFDVCNSDNINSALDGITREYQEDEAWKKYFAGDLLSKMIEFNDNGLNQFSFTIAFREGTVLLLTGRERTRADNMEINTFLLYTMINCENKQLHFAGGDFLLDENGNIKRYIEVGEKRVGYLPNDNNQNPFVDLDTNLRYSLREAKEFLENS